MSSAKYVAFDTVYRPDQMPGQKRRILRWPYTEGLTIDEAMHPLTFMAVGIYGKELLNQNGAPMRLVIPWKYGFKSDNPKQAGIYLLLKNMDFMPMSIHWLIIRGGAKPEKEE